jgi:DNA-binding IscR family transcriptional regulator
MKVSMRVDYGIRVLVDLAQAEGVAQTSEMAEVMAALGNPPSLRCLEQPSDCVQSTLCVQRDVWRQIDEATQKLLAAISIGEMAHQQERRHEGGMYYI